MYQYNLIQDRVEKSYLVIRTPDYKSSGWRIRVTIDMFTSDFDNKARNFAAAQNKDKPLTDALENTLYQLLYTGDTPTAIEDDHPEYFI